MLHVTHRIAMAALLGLLGTGCEKEPEPVQEDPCPNISMDGLAGDWIKVTGKRGDHRNRIRIKGEPGNYSMILIPGYFSKIALKGQKRDIDYVFEEQFTGRAQEQFQTGYRQKHRVYVEPYHKACAMRMVVAKVELGEGGKEKERPRTPGYEEYLPFPEGADFTFEIPTGFLFLGEAARNRKLEESQLVEFEGYPKPDIALGEAIPVGVFTQASADGPEGCSYDMDLYFDDQPYKGTRDAPSESAGKGVAAGPVKDGYRHWYVPAWFAPFSGNHMFEMYRYRTCSGKRELIEINGLEAVLQ
ncbi:MAG: hypothetical protein ABIO70_29170 [Pseudomonadota bacterium]